MNDLHLERVTPIDGRFTCFRHQCRPMTALLNQRGMRDPQLRRLRQVRVTGRTSPAPPGFDDKLRWGA